jgi:hypothetical protein
LEQPKIWIVGSEGDLSTWKSLRTQ